MSETTLNNTEDRFIKISRGLEKRHANSRRLKAFGMVGIITAIGFLAVLLTTIISNGYTALKQTELQIAVTLPIDKLSNDEGKVDLKKTREFNWIGFVRKSFRAEFPGVTGVLGGSSASRRCLSRPWSSLKTRPAVQRSRHGAFSESLTCGLTKMQSAGACVFVW